MNFHQVFDRAMWGWLAACGGLLTRLERRLPTGAQLNKPPNHLFTRSG
jgi:hypothetical protein